MKRTREVLALVLLAVGILVGLAAIVVMLQISSAVKHADAGLGRVLTQAGETVASAQQLSDEGYKAVHASRITIDNLNRAAIDERQYFERDIPGVMGRLDVILDNVQTATADADPLLRSATARVDGLAPVEAGLTDLVGKSTELVGSSADLVADPRVTDAIGNLDAASAELAAAGKDGAAAMGSVKAMAADGQDEVHRLTHPRPLVSIADWTLKVFSAIGGWF